MQTADNVVLDELSGEDRIIQSPPASIDAANSPGSVTSPPTTQEAEASASSTDESHACVLGLPCIRDVAGSALPNPYPLVVNLQQFRCLTMATNWPRW